MSKLSQQELNKRKAMFAQGLGWCNQCREFKPITEFSKSKQAPFGHYHRCKSCHSDQRKGDKASNRKMRDRARMLTGYYINLAGNCCQRCGYDRSQFALDFHHVNPDEKDENPSVVITNGNHDQVIKEIDKCVLLCANCHREFTAKAWQAEFVKRNGIGWTVKRKSIVLAQTKHDDYDNLPDKYRYSQLSLT